MHLDVTNIYKLKLIQNLSSSISITMTDVIENPEIPWDYQYMSMNPNITWNIISKYPEISWDINYIGYNTMSCPVYRKKYRILYDTIIREINYII